MIELREEQEMQHLRKAVYLSVIFILPRIISCSSVDQLNYDPTNKAELSRKERRKALRNKQSKDDGEIQQCTRNKLKFVIWSLKRQKKRSARTAYKMAILASLAYHNFRDAQHYGFSLIDDHYPKYLLGSNHSAILGKKRNPIKEIVTEGIARFRVSICIIRSRVAKITNVRSRRANSAKPTTQQCKQKLLQKYEAGKKYKVNWFFSNWHEENKAKIKWHDTDLIIATSGKSEIVLAFAGTASTADAVTNVQTLEPASHSGLFGIRTNSTNVTSVEGNIHRGFLNAYARVTHGEIQRLDNMNHTNPASLKGLDDYFIACIQQTRSLQTINSTEISIVEQDSSNNVTKKKIKKHRKKRKQQKEKICHSRGDKLLMHILREVTTTALKSGQTVHVVGHSLAGALATYTHWIVG